MLHLDLTCVHCGFICGAVEVPMESVAGKTVTQELFGFDDVRCDSCKKEHGDYKEMHDRARIAGLSHDEFRDLITKAEGKQKKFDPLLTEAVSKKKP